MVVVGKLKCPIKSIQKETRCKGKQQRRRSNWRLLERNWITTGEELEEINRKPCKYFCEATNSFSRI